MTSFAHGVCSPLELAELVGVFAALFVCFALYAREHARADALEPRRIPNAPYAILHGARP